MWKEIRSAVERGQLACDVRKDLFGGTGEVHVWPLIGAQVPPFDCVLACELAPQGSVGTHRQERSSELVVFVEGEGEATVTGRAVTVGPGVVVGLPLGASLAIRNLGATPLRYLIVKATGASS